MLAVQLREIYVALEDAVAAFRGHQLVEPLYDEVLLRSPALLRDLAATQSAQIPVLPATRAYVEYLRASQTPERVVANHYVRYLGDLSGGGVIATMLRRHYGIGEEELNFYHFDVDKVKVYKDGYRARLDALTDDPQVIDEIVREAQAAFAHNQAVFADISRSAPVLHQSLGVA